VSTSAHPTDSRIHPTAVIDPRAELASDVEVGPYCIIGPRVRIGAGTRLIGHVMLEGATTLGRGNLVHAFAALGCAPQIKKAPLAQGSLDAREAASGPRPSVSSLVIGDENVFREHVTVSSSSGNAPTSIGSKNLFMAGAHVAHDVRVGSHCVLANAVQLAGHVVIEDWVTFGGLAGVAQHLRVGQSAFVAAGAMCERDVPPFVIVQGDRARIRALNVVGLERRGVSAASMASLKKAFVATFVRSAAHVGFAQALRELDRSDPLVEAFARALSRSVSPHG